MENNTYVNSSPPLYICWSIGRRLKINRRNLSGAGDNDQQGKGKAEVGTRYASRHRREAWGGQLLLFFLFLRRWTSFSFFFEMVNFFFSFLFWGAELLFSFFFEVTNLIFISFFWGYELLFSFIYWGDKDIQRWQYPRIIEVIFFFLLVMTIHI